MKENRVLLIAFCVFSGWLLTGWGFTTQVGPLVSTLAFVLGLALVITGVVMIIRQLTQ
jgi:hypothetical protein